MGDCAQRRTFAIPKVDPLDLFGNVNVRFLVILSRSNHFRSRMADGRYDLLVYGTGVSGHKCFIVQGKVSLTSDQSGSTRCFLPLLRHFLSCAGLKIVSRTNDVIGRCHRRC